jgi:all-trans-nonaprenyl-diphosphate synthase
MEQLTVNLKNVVGQRSPLLNAAADQIFQAGGKRLRPAIVFLVARATIELVGLRCECFYGGRACMHAHYCPEAGPCERNATHAHRDITEKHRRLAEITEMIHTASLMHDDVVDESPVRRGAAPSPCAVRALACQLAECFNACVQAR